jgi:hypothetical protein
MVDGALILFHNTKLHQRRIPASPTLGGWDISLCAAVAFGSRGEVPQATRGKHVSTATVLAQHPRDGDAPTGVDISSGLARAHMRLGGSTFLASVICKHDGGAACGYRGHAFGRLAAGGLDPLSPDHV